MMKEFKNIRILYVEDEEKLRENALIYFRNMFSDVYAASDAFEAMELFKEKKPHIIITDIKLPKQSGLEMIEK